MSKFDDNQSVDSSSSLFTPRFSETSRTVRSQSSASCTNEEDRKPLQQNKPDVATKEGKAIFKARIGLYAVLLVTAFLSFFAVYKFAIEEEVDSLHTLFDGHSSEIISVTNQKVDKILEALDAFAFSISSQAAETKQYTNASWPFYRLPRWSQSAAKLAETTGFESPYIGLAPIVRDVELQDWEQYYNAEAPIWYQESMAHESKIPDLSAENMLTVPFGNYSSNDGLYLPIWQQYPMYQSSVSVGFELLSKEPTRNSFDLMRASAKPVIHMGNGTTSDVVPASYLIQPVHDETRENRNLVGALLVGVKWEEYLENLFAPESGTIDVFLKTSCQQGANAVEETLHEVTYQLNGPLVQALGYGDLHDSAFDDMEVVHVFVETIDDAILSESYCIPKITMHIYPTKDFQQKSQDSQSPLFKGSMGFLLSVIPALLFLVYDFLVRRRQRKVMDRIMKQDLIVSNVFPTAVRDRLYRQEDHATGKNNFDTGGDGYLRASSKDDDANAGGAPLADLFPNTTVVFADIAGFTAWASQREPQQVFMLLESIYMAFDKIAYHRNVFKVETVGDCYVAVTGLPDPCKNHAIMACKFARDCLKKMNVLTRKLEVSLGPDTADLELRVGIHSGQVTAGVLRGERSRFQLFGDTMNTAARMESSGERNKIQISQCTADLLKTAGLAKWIVPRKSTVYIKGKGDMQTYWILTKRLSSPSREKSDMSRGTAETAIEEGSSRFIVEEEITSEMERELTKSYRDDEIEEGADLSKMERLVEWNVETLSSLLCQIIASRGPQGEAEMKPSSCRSLTLLESSIGNNGTVLEEFVPIIPLKHFNAEELKQRRDANTVNIGVEAKSQLRRYLATIATMYNQDNPFHNFEHASHVTASVKKLLKRIVNVGEENGLCNSGLSQSLDLVDLASHSYGITSDPLTQFAVVFSAIIHDVDHPGVPNAQLCKENTRQAQMYKQKSVAEQNSVELAWLLLMQEDYSALRACIYQTEDELKRFRQLVVNTVMATDIVDKELQALRKDRWETAFAKPKEEEMEGSIFMSMEDLDADANRKATIVIEHLIQASDVSHTMQHWHIYKQWNQKFFMECYDAYKKGRAETDPSINWYKGEIGFFDFYVIPLARKLDNCGVFGVASDEYMDYAVANRDEWVREGQKLVECFKEAYYQTEYAVNEDQDKGKSEAPKNVSLGIIK